MEYRNKAFDKPSFTLRIVRIKGLRDNVLAKCKIRVIVL